MGRDVYGAQAFRLHKGRWESAGAKACRDADEARREAERMAARRGVAGAVATLRRNYVRGSDDGESPITIAAYGEVPAEARDALPF